MNLLSRFNFQINYQQKKFLFAALLWFVGCQILDIIFPIDLWLTDLVVAVSRGLIYLWLDVKTICVRIHTPYEGYALIEKGYLFNIAHSCNGKAILFLYVAFLWAIPNKSIFKKIIFTFTGLGLICVANVLRIVALFKVLRSLPNWFDLLHHGIFQFAMYGIVLFLWMLFLRKKRIFGRDILQP